MKYTWFDEKRNTLYIKSNLLLPDTKGMSFKERCKAYDEAFSLSYEERLRRFCKDDKIRAAVESDITAHKGCKLSEYCNA